MDQSAVHNPDEELLVDDDIGENTTTMMKKKRYCNNNNNIPNSPLYLPPAAVLFVYGNICFVHFICCIGRRSEGGAAVGVSLSSFSLHSKRFKYLPSPHVSRRSVMHALLKCRIALASQTEHYLLDVPSSNRCANPVVVFVGGA